MLLNPDEADTYQLTFEQLMTALLRTFQIPADPSRRSRIAPIGSA